MNATLWIPLVVSSSMLPLVLMLPLPVFYEFS